MKRLARIVLIAVLAAALVETEAAAKKIQLRAVEGLVAAMNAKDATAAMEFFAFDATATDPAGSMHEGSGAIREWITGLLESGYHADAGNMELSRDGKVTWTMSMSYGDLVRLRVAPVEAFGQAVVREDGKINSLAFRFPSSTVLKMRRARVAAADDLVRTAINTIINQGRIEATDRFLSPDFVDRDGFPGLTPGARGVREGVRALRRAFPDIHVAVADVVVNGDRAVCRVVARGTMRGPLFGRTATGETFRGESIHIFRIEGDRLVEHWGAVDRDAVLDQISVKEEPVAAVARSAAPVSEPCPDPVSEEAVDGLVNELVDRVADKVTRKLDKPEPVKKKTWY